MIESRRGPSGTSECPRPLPSETNRGSLSHCEDNSARGQRTTRHGQQHSEKLPRKSHHNAGTHSAVAMQQPEENVSLAGQN